jgi:hypothetical protein
VCVCVCVCWERRGGLDRFIDGLVWVGGVGNPIIIIHHHPSSPIHMHTDLEDGEGAVEPAQHQLLLPVPVHVRQ